MMRLSFNKKLGCLIALTILVYSFPNQANAQKFDKIQVIIKPQLNIEQSRRIRQIVRDIGGKRLASVTSGGNPDSVVMEPAGYSIVPTADLTVTETAAAWNVWLDGSAGYLESTTPLRGYNGSQLSISLGADTNVNEKLTIGAIINHAATDITNSFVPGGSTTSAISLGPYMALFLTDTLVFTGSFLYTWTDNDAVSGPVTAAYGSESWAFNGSLTSYHQLDNWMLAPTVGVSFNEEYDEAYVDTGATTFGASTTRTGSLAFGGSATYTYALDNGMTIQPALSVEGEWTFLRSVGASASSGVATDKGSGNFDVNITASSDFQLSNSVSLSLSSTVAGLAKPDYLSVIGGGRLSISF